MSLPSCEGKIQARYRQCFTVDPQTCTHTPSSARFFYDSCCGCETVAVLARLSCTSSTSRCVRQHHKRPHTGSLSAHSNNVSQLIHKHAPILDSPRGFWTIRAADGKASRSLLALCAHHHAMYDNINVRPQVR